MTKTQIEFSKRLCPHRGIGQENTLASIKTAIAAQPFMVEFDVQMYRHKLHLGHPPAINKEATLAEALRLFLSDQVMPKVDLKLSARSLSEGLKVLSNELISWSPRTSLINIDGELDADGFMSTESRLMRMTDDKTLLNIDLRRYKSKSLGEINKHIQSLARPPFSVSPNLDDNIEYSIEFALSHRIGHIHFWAFQDRQYDLELLYSLMQRVLGNGLEVYFDIKYENIISPEFINFRL